MAVQLQEPHPSIKCRSMGLFLDLTQGILNIQCGG
ncbi:hypothetical protein SLEP1_g50273 [Rubroshorea leprosula]|uniref:Uncharacterized protein n=1 Tax=Rubroshorea leprosula TaxID=152421 RepID=A0AAV5M1T5_9ROSI|nr:hypothetical protein SLEP1_g50273 [Rubroshorea leprosula]